MKNKIILISLCFLAIFGFTTAATAVQITSISLDVGYWDGTSFTSGPYPSGTPDSPLAYHIHRWDTDYQGGSEPIWGLGVASTGSTTLLNDVTTNLTALSLGSYTLWAQPDFTYMQTNPGSNLSMTQDIIDYNLLGTSYTNGSGTYNPTMGYVLLSFEFDNGDTASAIFEVLGGVLMSDTTDWTQVWTDSTAYELAMSWSGLYDDLMWPYEALSPGWDYEDLSFNISAQAVPIPGAIYLLGTGLLGLLGLRKRIKR